MSLQITAQKTAVLASFSQSTVSLQITEQITAVLEEHDFDEIMENKSAEGEKAKSDMSQLFETYRKLGALRVIHAKESTRTMMTQNQTTNALREMQSRHDPDHARKLEDRFQRAKDELVGHRKWCVCASQLGGMLCLRHADQNLPARCDALLSLHGIIGTRLLLLALFLTSFHRL